LSVVGTQRAAAGAAKAACSLAIRREATASVVALASTTNSEPNSSSRR
jgi:hypothetical protein